MIRCLCTRTSTYVIDLKKLLEKKKNSSPKKKKSRKHGEATAEEKGCTVESRWHTKGEGNACWPRWPKEGWEKGKENEAWKRRRLDEPRAIGGTLCTCASVRASVRASVPTCARVMSPLLIIICTLCANCNAHTAHPNLAVPCMQTSF